MLDVARMSGVSLKTVSRVVNGEDNVRASTARRVDDAVRRLGFRPNNGARQMRSGRTASIGMVVEDLADPFYSALAGAVEEVAQSERHLLLIGSAEGSAERERSLTEALVSNRVDGLVVVPALREHGWLAPELAAGTPIVFVDRPPHGLETDTVLSDNAGGMRSAVEHLAAHGHRRIGFLGDDPAFWTAGQRLAGFRDATTTLGLASDAVDMGPYEHERLVARLRAWTGAADPVTALVTGNNRVTVTALRALRAADLRRLSMVGFDDLELAELLDPPITVVAQDPAGLGAQAARLLFGRLGPHSGPPRTVVLPTRLVVRASVSVR